MKLNPLAKDLTRKALISILVQLKEDDETCTAVKLIEALYICEPSPEVAKEILNILQPEVIHNVEGIPECEPT